MKPFYFRKFIKENKNVFFILLILSFVISLIFYRNLNFYFAKRASGPEVMLNIVSDSNNFAINQKKTLKITALFNGATNKKLDYAKVVLAYPSEYFEVVSINYALSGLTRKIYADSPSVANLNGNLMFEFGANKAGNGPSTDTLITLATIEVLPKKSGNNLVFNFLTNYSQLVLNNYSQLSLASTGAVYSIYENGVNPTLTTTPTNTLAPTATVPIATPTETESEPTPTEADEQDETPTPEITEVETPTPTPTETNTKIILKLKLQGVTTEPKNNVPVKFAITLFNEALPKALTFTAEIKSDTNGIYQSEIISNEIPALPGYSILIKGPKHLARRFCELGLSEMDPYKYSCETPNIELIAGNNNLDFTFLPLLVGDLPKQDGLLNSNDVKILSDNLFKTEAVALEKADLNYDGVVNATDYALLLINMDKIYEEDE